MIMQTGIMSGQRGLPGPGLTWRHERGPERASRVNPPPPLVYRGFRPRPPRHLPLHHGGGHFPTWVSLLIIVAVIVIVTMIMRSRR